MPAFSYAFSVRETADLFSAQVRADAELKANANVSISEVRASLYAARVSITERDDI